MISSFCTVGGCIEVLPAGPNHVTIRDTNPGDPMKSSHSIGTNACVDVAPAPGGVYLRHSRTTGDGCSPTQLQFTRAEFRAFILGVRAGEFDHFCEEGEAPQPTTHIHGADQ